MSDLSKYPKTEFFEVIDTIIVPHPYCIGPALVAHASDHFSGMLGHEAIESAEKAEIYCETCVKAHRKTGANILKYSEHEKALLVNCKIEDHNLLKNYLLDIKDMAEKDGFVGFAFKKGY